MIDLANGQPAPSEDATRRRATATPRRRRCRPRRSVSREDNLLFRRAASRGRVSRRAASRYSFYQRETPLSLRLGAAARSYGAPDTGNLRGPRPRAARVPIGQASVSGRIRRRSVPMGYLSLREAPVRGSSFKPKVRRALGAWAARLAGQPERQRNASSDMALRDPAAAKGVQVVAHIYDRRVDAEVKRIDWAKTDARATSEKERENVIISFDWDDGKRWKTGPIAEESLTLHDGSPFRTKDYEQPLPAARKKKKTERLVTQIITGQIYAAEESCAHCGEHVGPAVRRSPHLRWLRGPGELRVRGPGGRAGGRLVLPGLRGESEEAAAPQARRATIARAVPEKGQRHQDSPRRRSVANVRKSDGRGEGVRPHPGRGLVPRQRPVEGVRARAELRGSTRAAGPVPAPAPAKAPAPAAPPQAAAPPAPAPPPVATPPAPAPAPAAPPQAARRPRPRRRRSPRRPRPRPRRPRRRRSPAARARAAAPVAPPPVAAPAAPRRRCRRASRRRRTTTTQGAA